MKNLTSFDNITYDTMVILYYCFNIKNHKLVEYTNKSQKLTEFLINNGTNIVIPEFLMSEIKNKGIRKISEEFIERKQLTNLPKNPDMMFLLGIEFKVKRKLEHLQNKEWFIVEPYIPSESIYNQIYTFFKELKNHPKLGEFLKKKKRYNPLPSIEDMNLIAFSKEKEYPIISNDYDLTFFAEELLKKRLCSEIFDFRDLDIYNN